MKHPQPDIQTSLTNSFVAKTGANRKFKRLWGTTTVKGVEVLNLRRHYHPTKSRPNNYKKLFKFLKVWKQVKDYKGEGIKSAWFTLNKSKGTEKSVNVSSNYVVNNLNRMWWDTNDGKMPKNLTLTTTIVISEDFTNRNTLTGFDWTSTKENLAQYVIDNYESLWANKKIVQEGVGVINKGSITDPVTNTTKPDEDDLSPDDPWLAIVSRYALRDSGIPCTIKDVSPGLGNANGVIYNTAVVTIEIPYHQFTSSDPIVSKIMYDMNPNNYPKLFKVAPWRIFDGFSTNNEHITQNLVRKVNYYITEEDSDPDTVSRQYLQWEDSVTTVSKYNNIWVQDGDKWYLKADVIDRPSAYGFKQTELNNYLFSLLDTGYKKKKVPLWKKIVAVVIFIVAVIVAFVYPPAASASSMAIAAAEAILVGAMVIALTTAVFSALGYAEWATAFGWTSRAIEPLVTVATIVTLTAGFQKSTEEVIKKIATRYVVDETFDLLGEFSDLGKLISDALSGNISDIVDAASKTIVAYTSIQSAKLERIVDRIKDTKAEYDKLNEETMMTNDVIKSFMNIYAKPATADWSMYAAVYDMPYERGGGNLAIGNIQKTTIQAIRKPYYNEAMFEGILLV